ncbi:MAG: thiol peroxidase [Anaerolineales bacterium]
MSKERQGLLKFMDRDVTVIGDDLKVGDKAPDFIVQTTDWKLLRGIGDTQGRVRIIGSLPSLNTPVCDRETRRFNEEASKLSKDLIVEMISMDLPFTLKIWCGAAGVDRVLTLSDHLSAEFGEKYGVLIKELRILRRAIFVVDRNDRITYVAYMPALGDEPDYDAVLSHAKAALG